MHQDIQRYYRQGDVILQRIQPPLPTGRLPHLTLAEGEVTGHAHRITAGEAVLYDHQGTLYLQVLSETAMLTHDEHGPLTLPRGDYTIWRQQDYEPAGWKTVSD